MQIAPDDQLDVWRCYINLIKENRMNRLYKSFFSKQLGRFVVTSEKARTKTKSSKTTTVAAAVVTTLGITFSAGALANSQTVGNVNTGQHNEVYGDESATFGQSNYTNGNQTVNVGLHNSTNVGDGNATFGRSNTTNGHETVNVGLSNSVNGTGDAIFGRSNTTQGDGNATFGNSNTTQGGINATFGNTNTTNGYHTVNVGQSNRINGSVNATFGHSNTTEGDGNAVFGQHNTTDGNLNINVGLNNGVDQAYKATMFGNSNSSNNDKITTVIGEGNNTISNAKSFIAGTNNQIAGLYGTNVVGLDNNVVSAPLPDSQTNGYWLEFNDESIFYRSGKTNVFGAENMITVGHSVNTIGNMNEFNGDNSSIVGNANMITADRTNIIGNNNWHYSARDFPHNDGDDIPLNHQYIQGMEGEVLIENLRKANAFFSAFPNIPSKVKNSDIVGSHNIVSGDRLLIAGQGNIVEGKDQSVIGHNNLATGEKTVALGTDNTVATNMLALPNMSEGELAESIESTPYIAAYLDNSHNYIPVAIGSKNTAMNGGIALGTENNAVYEGISIGRNNTAIAGNIALGSGVTSTGETLTKEAFYIGGTATNQLAIGSNGNNMRITGVAAGANPNDAVNVEQLTAVVNDIDPKGNVKYKPILDADGNNVLDDKGLKTYDFSLVELATKATVETEDKYKVSVVKEGTGTVIENVGNATQADHAVNKGQLDFAIAGLTDGINGAVKYERDANGNINFDKAVLEGTQTVIAADDKYKDVQVVKSGGTVIDNVANATEADHAVNKGQLDLEIAGVKDGLDGTVKYGRDSEGKIDFTNVILANEAIKGTDANGIDYVQSGGSTINNVATATEYHQAINKGQFDQGLNALRNGAVMYALNVDGSVNKNLVNLAGAETTISSSNKYNVAVVTSGGTVLNNVANATEADHAVNKGQLDFAIAGVTDGINGAVKYERDANGNINFDKAVLEGTQTVIAADDKYKDVQVVKSGGTVIDNVANATEADHAVNKGQLDLEIAGVKDGLDGTVKYGRDSEGKIDFTNVILANEAIKGTDANGIDYVQSGGSTINNVATATEYHQAINKGQFDQGLNALRNGAVMYALNVDGSVNKNIVNLMGSPVVAGESHGVQVAVSGGTTINNVATATEFHQAVNKGQLDEAIAQIYLENDGASVKYDVVNGGIDYKNVTLKNNVVAGTDQYGIEVVASGGTNINNVANATKYHQAVNKGQMDSEFAKRDDLIAGAVQYDRNSDNSINFDKVTFAGEKATTAVNEIGVEVVTSGGTVLANVGNATEAHHAINKGMFDDAIARLEAETEGTVKYDKNTDGTIDYNNITLAGGTAVVEKNADGIDVVTSGGTNINNVANATQAHQAINKGQFDEALSKIEGESAGNVKYNKNADGSVDYNNVSYAGDKAKVEKNDLGIDVVTSGGTTLKNIATATQADEAINKGQFDDGLARLKDGSVQYARNEDGSVNKNSVVMGGDKAVIAKNSNGIEVVKSGGTVISNVAVATQADHAINKGQFDEGLHQVRDYADEGDISTLHNANNYTDNRVNALWSEFQDESKDLRAGIAGAMAVGNLPQPSEAGYSMFSMGVATYKGQQAIAMGLSAVTEDKRYIFKIAATTTSRNDTGGAASVGMQWK